ncbi:MAG TPA: CCA tRNA nucleotidyltransferase, partial [Lichenihabitans sp.]|nr:CCA tRNA nucleotidyltransferase [Lichenihabitans sp.]
LLGLPPGDLDLATTLRPEMVRKLAKTARLRTIPTGIAHGTVTILADDLPFEVTTLREDVETDGRHAVVRFGRDFEADARRRDFTINALSVDRDGQVFDYVGGRADLERRRIRFIGNADLRIREDYLRILRFFRFHATYGAGPLDPDGHAAAVANRAGLGRLSRERIRSEMLKILAAAGAAAAVAAMHDAGILTPILGQPGDPGRLARLAALDPRPGDAVLRLGALALRGVGDIEALRTALRLSNAEADRLSAALEARRGLGARIAPPTTAELRRMLFFHGREATADALRLAYADEDRPDARAWQRAMADLAGVAVPVLPISGRDLVARGITGPALGAALARFRSVWAQAGFPADPRSIAHLRDAAASVETDDPQATS